MADTIKFKRGLKENMPQLSVGEPGFCTDTGELFIGTEEGNKRIGHDYVNVKWFGAKGDGETNDAQAIQAAINYISDIDGGTLYFPPGRYMIKELYVLENLPSNLYMKGVRGKSILDFSNRSGSTTDLNYKYLISAFGDYEEAISLVSDGLKDSNILEFNTTGLDEGDLLIITSDYEWTGDTFNVNQGEYIIIDEILSSTKVRIKSALHEDYLMSNNSRVHKVNPVENIIIDGLTFIGQGRVGNGDYGGDLGIGITYGRNIEVKNCEFIDIDEIQLEFRSCYNFKAINNYHYHSKYFSSSGGIGESKPVEQTTRGTVQYQIRVADCCQYGIIKDCVGEGSRHMFNTGHSFRYNDGTIEQTNRLFGINRHITIENCYSKNTWHAAFSTHNDCEYVNFINCISENTGLAGFNLRSKNIRLINCTTINAKRLAYLSIHPQDISIESCYVADCEGLVYGFVETDFPMKNIIIKNNIIKNCISPILLNNSAYTGQEVEGIVISNNYIYNTVNEGNYSPIRLTGKFNAIISENKIINTSIGYQIRLENIYKAIIDSNKCINGYRIFYTDSNCEQIIISNNICENHQFKTIENNSISPTTQNNISI